MALLRLYEGFMKALLRLYYGRRRQRCRQCVSICFFSASVFFFKAPLRQAAAAMSTVAAEEAVGETDKGEVFGDDGNGNSWTTRCAVYLLYWYKRTNTDAEGKQLGV